jgi:hypothetical protein
VRVKQPLGTSNALQGPRDRWKYVKGSQCATAVFKIIINIWVNFHLPPSALKISDMSLFSPMCRGTEFQISIWEFLCSLLIGDFARTPQLLLWIVFPIGAPWRSDRQFGKPAGFRRWIMRQRAKHKITLGKPCETV